MKSCSSGHRAFAGSPAFADMSALRTAPHPDSARGMLYPDSNQYIRWRSNNFDAIRLFAALQVAAVHSISQFNLSGAAFAMLDAGLRMFPGVPIFFLTSGFLISASYEKSASIGQYLRNRCLRIYPALWVCLVLSIPVLVIKIAVNEPGNTISSREWLAWWIAQMSGYEPYAPRFLQGGRLNDALWTISVELEFYLLVPCLYFLLRLHQRRGEVALLSLMGLSMLLHWMLCHAPAGSRVLHYLFILDTALPYLWIFLTGVLIQRHWDQVRPYVAGRAHRWLLGYVLLAATLRSFKIGVGSGDFNCLLLLPLAGVVLACAVTAPQLARKVLAGNDISYGLYLYHMLVIGVLLSFGHNPGAPGALAAILISIGLGILSWQYVEKSFLDRKRRSLRRSTESTPAIWHLGRAKSD